jgi:hypothetical protein
MEATWSSSSFDSTHAQRLAALATSASKGKNAEGAGRATRSDESAVKRSRRRTPGLRQSRDPKVELTAHHDDEAQYDGGEDRTREEHPFHTELDRVEDREDEDQRDEDHEQRAEDWMPKPSVE